MSPNSPPTRPVSVPDDAHWNAHADQWERGKVDGDCNRQGAWNYWGSDGWLSHEYSFVDDMHHGSSRCFLPGQSQGEPPRHRPQDVSSTKLASKAQWHRGHLLDVSYFRPESGSEHSVWLDVPTSIIRIDEFSHDGSSYTSRSYLDVNGLACCAKGKPLPTRPTVVPSTASYLRAASASDENQWVDGSIKRGSERRTGTWKWWTTDGELCRTEIHSAQGLKITAFDATTHVPFEEEVSAFLRGEEHRLESMWSASLHDEICRRLPSYPASYTAAYLRILHIGVLSNMGPSYRVFVSKPRELIALADSWTTLNRHSEDLAATFQIYELALQACLALFQLPSVEQWWEGLTKILLPPKKERKDKGYSRGIERVIASVKRKDGSVRKEVSPFIDGTVAASLKVAHALCKQGETSQLSNSQLYHLATTQTKTEGIHYAKSEGRDSCRNLDIILRNPKTGETWFSTTDGIGLFFDGSSFSHLWNIQRNPCDYYLHVAGNSCDQRVLLWSGKHSWTLLQRYGRHVLWHTGIYFTGRGQAEPSGRSWVTAPTVKEAQRFISLVREQAPSNAREAPWYRGKNAIERTYAGADTRPLGVWKNYLVSNHALLEKFQSHEEAVSAFSSLELARFKNGATIRRLDLVGPFKAD